MPDLKNFSHEQRGVALRMAAVLCIAVFVSATCLRHSVAAPASLTDRLVVAAKADVFVLFWLAAAIGNVARLRFFSVDDIAGSGSGPGTLKVGHANAVLQNTLEQTVLAIPVHVALAMMVAASMPLIITFAVLFSIGRMLFWNGYAKGAKSRAFGFALTFYPSVVGLVIAAAAAMGL